MGVAKAHKKKAAGRGAGKKKKGGKSDDGPARTGTNARAFGFQSAGKAKAQQARTAEKQQRRLHTPLTENLATEPPPLVVLVQGPPGVGKSTLIRCLVKHYTGHSLGEVKGPITVVAGKSRRITFVECPSDLLGMLDAAKYCDLALLLVDASYGFEMETFEFLNLLQVHGFPKVMGVLTHLDSFTDQAQLKKAKKQLKARFWAEIYDGAKLFYLSGIQYGKYLKREVLNLARFISVMKTRPLAWRLAHPYLVADRLEDLTPTETVRATPNVDREVALYGWLRGANLQHMARVHLAGVGDFTVQDAEMMSDPCPLPGSGHKRLDDKQRLIYAPMSDIGGLTYDKDAVYIDIPSWKVQYSQKDPSLQVDGEEPEIVAPSSRAHGNDMVMGLQKIPDTVDAQLAAGSLRLFKGGALLAGGASGIEGANGVDDSSDLDSEDEGEDSDNEAYDENDERTTDDEEDGNGEDAEAEEDEEGAEDDEVEDQAAPSGPALGWHASMHAASIKKSFTNGEDVVTPIIPSSNSLAALVYASIKAADPQGWIGAEAGFSSGSDEDGDDLFTPRQQKPPIVGTLLDIDACDGSRSVAILLQETAPADARPRFVTADWAQGQRRARARPAVEDEALQGPGTTSEGVEDHDDFEDHESGSSSDGADAKWGPPKAKGAGKSAAPDDAQATMRSMRQPIEPTFFDAVKAEAAIKAASSRAALDALPAHTRSVLEGLRPGMYVRIRLKGVPCELIANHDPSRPMLLGGLGQQEDAMGTMKLRFKRHRWFPKILKTRDPLVLSVGWRRIQALPVYASEDHNRRLRSLKYTPEHMHCMAVMYGPLAPQNTGVVAVQSTAGDAKGWRVSGTGVVLELDAQLQVLKKLKLVGNPVRIMRHTAFIQDMFTSQLEASKFEGAHVRTVSGVRGTIKKAVPAGGLLKLREGTVRAMFEDKILISDLVFLRAWVAVDIPRFVNPVTDLLQPAVAPQRSAKRLNGVRSQAARLHARDPAPPAPVSALLTQLQAATGQHISTSTTPGGIPIDFKPSLVFRGPQPGHVFTLGPLGQGYYPEHSMSTATAPALGNGTVSSLDKAQQAKARAALNAAAGWTSMRTVAALRRDQNTGAPRPMDSLYRPVARAPRKFNPLHVPASLQAALPFKTKPKLEPAGKGLRRTLEQKRATVMDPKEKHMATLVQQLNAIRNSKVSKRREQQVRKAGAKAVTGGKEEAWRAALNKERRKERYRNEGQAEKRKASALEGGGKYKKSKK